MNTSKVSANFESVKEEKNDRSKSANSFVKFYRRFPATTLVLAPYVILILPPAFIFGNDSVWFLIRIALVALAGTLIVDIFWPRKRSANSNPGLTRYGRELYYLALGSILISVIVGILAALAGKGSVAVQIGRVEVTSGVIGTLDSFVGSWNIVGFGFLVAAYMGRNCSKREFYLVTAIVAGGVFIETIFTQRTAPLFSVLTFLVMFLMLFGLIRFRVVILGILATLLVWPTVFTIRNQLRISDGVKVSEKVSAFDRIRFDLQFSRAEGLEVPLDVSNTAGYLYDPSVTDIFRYGLIPRILDPNRDLVSTGNVINIALGGSTTSSFTFGPVTSVYVMQGPLFLFLYYAFLAILLNFVWRGGRNLTPIRLMLLASIISGPFGWFATQPDVLIGVIQSLIACLPLFGVLALIPKKKREIDIEEELARSSI